LFIRERHAIELSALDIDEVVKADFPDFAATESERHSDPQNPIFTLQHHKRRWKTVTTTASGCSCGRVTAELRPCKHLALVYTLAGRGYPVHLINCRWREARVEEPPIDDAPLELLDIIAASRLPSAPSSEDEGEDEELRGVPPDSATGNDVARYKKVFFIGKQLATLGAGLPDDDFRALVATTGSARDRVQARRSRPRRRAGRSEGAPARKGKFGPARDRRVRDLRRCPRDQEVPAHLDLQQARRGRE
jgi:hypothetical protein